MYPFILCFCGRSLGDLYDLFCAMRAQRYEEAYKEMGTVIDPLFIPFSDSFNITLADIFEALHINQVCCRMHIHTQIEYKHVY